jgi:hypothetical protein
MGVMSRHPGPDQNFSGPGVWHKINDVNIEDWRNALGYRPDSGYGQKMSNTSHSFLVQDTWTVFRMVVPQNSQLITDDSSRMWKMMASNKYHHARRLLITRFQAVLSSGSNRVS